VLEQFYGRLERLLAVPIFSSDTYHLDDTDPPVLFLAVVRSYKTDKRNAVGMVTYPLSDQGRVTVVDVTTIQCLVGRVRDPAPVHGERWAIVDRSGSSSS
jgi:hypothetical protein